MRGKSPCADGSLLQSELKEMTPLRRTKKNKSEGAKSNLELDEADSQHEDSDQAESPNQKEAQEAPKEKDFWSVSGDAIIRFHRNLRQRLYVPSEVDFPIPLRYADVQRRTETDLDSMSESTIQYYWNVQGDISLSAPWTGKKRFSLLSDQDHLLGVTAN